MLLARLCLPSWKVWIFVECKLPWLAGLTCGLLGLRFEWCLGFWVLFQWQGWQSSGWWKIGHGIHIPSWERWGLRSDGVWVVIVDEFCVGYWFCPWGGVISTEDSEVDFNFCGDGFLSGAENHPLSKPMVNHDQKRVKAIEEGKVSDEITGDLLEQAGSNWANESEGGNGEMCVGFIFLTNGATFNIFMHEGSKAGPPKLGGNQLMGL